MSIASLFKDTYSFLKTLFLGDRVDILLGGEIWALCIIVSGIACVVLWKRKRFIHIKAALAAIALSAYSFYFVNAIAPIELARGGLPFESRKGMLFGMMWKPFYLMPGVGEVFDIYKYKMLYFLVIGCAAALLFRTLYKPQRFALFAVGSFVLELLLVLLDDVTHGGVVSTLDLSVPVLCIPAMLAGWGLARLIIRLGRRWYDRFHEVSK